MTALSLFRPPPALGRLGLAQRMVLAELVDRGSLSDAAAGRIVHARRYGDGHLVRGEGPCCAYGPDDGRAVLGSLRRRGLVKRRRDGGVWVLREPAVVRDALGHSRDEGQIPW